MNMLQGAFGAALGIIGTLILVIQSMTLGEVRELKKGLDAQDARLTDIDRRVVRLEVSAK